MLLNRLLTVSAMLSLFSSGILTTSAQEDSPSGAYERPMRGTIRGLAGVEWYYEGEIIITNLQGYFCEGFKCAHGTGRLETDGDWGYTGTFHNGDIIGKGTIEDDDGEHPGLVRSTSVPGGAPPLCGEPGDKEEFLIDLRAYKIQLHADKTSCKGDSCATAQCLEDWAESVNRHETLLRTEAQQIKAWHEPVQKAQKALLNGSTRPLFDKITVAGKDLQAFLIDQGWKPQPGATVYLQRYYRFPEGEYFQLILDGPFVPPYTNNPYIPISDMLPMQLLTGTETNVVTDPWTAIGLTIKINPANYAVSLSPSVL